MSKEETPVSPEASEGQEELNKKIGELEKQKNEYLAGWQRARADFLNYKKEEMERVKGFLEYANEEFILKLMPILDNFTEAEKSIPEDKKDDYLKGISQIKKQFEDFLKAQGLEEIKTIGEKFNPSVHEVVGEIETKDGVQGTIIEEVQKGYKISGRLLRPAKVKIVK